MGMGLSGHVTQILQEFLEVWGRHVSVDIKKYASLEPGEYPKPYVFRMRGGKLAAMNLSTSTPHI